MRLQVALALAVAAVGGSAPAQTPAVAPAPGPGTVVRRTTLARVGVRGWSQGGYISAFSVGAGMSRSKEECPDS